MLHFWFNTFFVEDDEYAHLVAAVDQTADGLQVKSVVHRSHSDNEAFGTVRTRQLFDKPTSTHRELQKMLHSELLSHKVLGCMSSTKTKATITNTKDLTKSGSAATKGLSLPISLKHQDNGFSVISPSADSTGLSGIDSDHNSKLYKVLVLQKSEIDRANKDKQNRLYPANFAVR